MFRARQSMQRWKRHDRPAPRGRTRLLCGSMLLSALLLLCSGCSASDSSSAAPGGAAMQPVKPPSIAANGPAGAYAFVYNNQIWLRADGQASAKQLTHMVLPNADTFAWGPLVWSPSGTVIAFALVQSAAGDVAARSAGPLYYVDVAKGDVSATGGTGGIYGHTYAWWDDRALLYSSANGIQLYDLGDADPRTWPVLSPFSDSTDGVVSVTTNNDISYGDIAVFRSQSGYNDKLFYTRAAITTPGAYGAVGTATLDYYRMPARTTFTNLDRSPHALDVPLFLDAAFPLTRNGARINIADLGVAYTTTSGWLATGAWQLTPDGGRLVIQQVSAIDGKGGTVKSTFCTKSSTFAAVYSSASACAPTLSAADAYALAAYPNLGISADGRHVAFTANDLVTSGGKVALSGWTTPPVWSPDGNVVAMTTPTSQSASASASGMNPQTNIVTYAPGKASVALIVGGQNLAWQPVAAR